MCAAGCDMGLQSSPCQALPANSTAAQRRTPQAAALWLIANSGLHIISRVTVGNHRAMDSRASHEALNGLNGARRGLSENGVDLSRPGWPRAPLVLDMALPSAAQLPGCCSLKDLQSTRAHRCRPLQPPSRPVVAACHLKDYALAWDICRHACTKPEEKSSCGYHSRERQPCDVCMVCISRGQMITCDASSTGACPQPHAYLIGLIHCKQAE